MLAIAMETYCRNELTESEALQIIKQAMPITEAQVPQLLQELYGSILRHTANGFAFQMRS
jgi:hemoglobin-like flavoprotein